MTRAHGQEMTRKMSARLNHSAKSNAPASPVRLQSHGTSTTSTASENTTGV